MEIKTLGVVGAGQMGSGIAQVASSSGLSVIMSDIQEEFLKKGVSAITKSLDRIFEEIAGSWMNRLEMKTSR